MRPRHTDEPAGAGDARLGALLVFALVATASLVLVLWLENRAQLALLQEAQAERRLAQWSLEHAQAVQLRAEAEVAHLAAGVESVEAFAQRHRQLAAMLEHMLRADARGGVELLTRACQGADLVLQQQPFRHSELRLSLGQAAALLQEPELAVQQLGLGWQASLHSDDARVPALRQALAVCAVGPLLQLDRTQDAHQSAWATVDQGSAAFGGDHSRVTDALELVGTGLIALGQPDATGDLLRLVATRRRAEPGGHREQPHSATDVAPADVSAPADLMTLLRSLASARPVDAVDAEQSQH